MKKILSVNQKLDLLHHKRSDKYVIATANTVEKLLFENCFSEITIEGLETVVSRSKKGQTLVFISNHQSEYDWMLLQTFLAQRYVRAAIQAGENLFIGPIDDFLRKCGAFMMVRDSKDFYSNHWFSSWLLKILGTEPFTLSKDQYNKLYLDQIMRILRENLHLMIFPGYETDTATGKIKYGRSYSGKFANLSPYVFLILNTAIKRLKIDNAFYIPINITYERVPEDIVFREYQAQSRKGKIAKYLYDHYYTFAKTPFSRRVNNQRSKVILRFGEGISINNSKKSRKTAFEVQESMSKLIKVYESSLIFASIDNHFRVDKRLLSETVKRNISELEKQKVDTSCLYERNEIKTLDSMLERTAKIFNRPNPISPTKTYKIIEYDKNEVFIHQPHLAYYYSNQLSHFLDKPET